MFTSSKFCAHLKNHTQMGGKVTSGGCVVPFPACQQSHRCLTNLEGLRWRRPDKFPNSVTSSRKENCPFSHGGTVPPMKMQDAAIISSLPLPQTNISHLNVHSESKLFFLLTNHKTHIWKRVTTATVSCQLR